MLAAVSLAVSCQNQMNDPAANAEGQAIAPPDPVLVTAESLVDGNGRGLSFTQEGANYRANYSPNNSGNTISVLIAPDGQAVEVREIDQNGVITNSNPVAFFSSGLLEAAIDAANSALSGNVASQASQMQQVKAELDALTRLISESQTQLMREDYGSASAAALAGDGEGVSAALSAMSSRVLQVAIKAGLKAAIAKNYQIRISFLERRLAQLKVESQQK